MLVYPRSRAFTCRMPLDLGQHTRDSRCCSPFSASLRHAGGRLFHLPAPPKMGTRAYDFISTFDFGLAKVQRTRAGIGPPAVECSASVRRALRPAVSRSSGSPRDRRRVATTRSSQPVSTRYMGLCPCLRYAISLCGPSVMRENFAVCGGAARTACLGPSFPGDNQSFGAPPSR
jgi:hypothetical protein